MLLAEQAGHSGGDLAIWAGVMTTLILTVGGIIVAVINRGQKQTAAKLGDPNGHGSLSNAVSTVIARLDAQDRLASEERRLRDEGQTRQLRILDALAEVRQKQETFLTHDDIDALDVIANLRDEVRRLTEMIGEPQEGWDSTPLLPYVHRWRHDMTNELTKVRNVNALLVERVVAALNLPADDFPTEGDTPNEE